MTDFTVENHGSIVLLQPHTSVGRIWAEDHIGHALRFGLAFVVEPRYLWPILDGIYADGLEVTNG